MTLRASALDDGNNLDIKSAVTGDVAGDSGIAFSQEIVGFSQAIARHDYDAMEYSRKRLALVAESVIVADVASVAATFNAINRVAGALGIPLDAPAMIMSKTIRDDLGVADYSTASNTKSMSIVGRIVAKFISPLFLRVMPKLMRMVAPKK